MKSFYRVHQVRAQVLWSYKPYETYIVNILYRQRLITGKMDILEKEKAVHPQLRVNCIRSIICC